MRYGCRSKFGYLKVDLAFALKRSEVGAEFRKYLNEYKNIIGK